MKAALGMMLVLLVGLGGALYWQQGVAGIQQALKTSGGTGMKFLPVLAIAFLLMGLVDTLLPKEVIEAWLTDTAGWRGIGIAWVAGMLTPAGSVVGLPIAAGLYKAGAGTAVLITYLTSMACLSFVRIPLELAFMGPRITTLRVLACLLLPPVAGYLARGMAKLVPMG